MFRVIKKTFTAQVKTFAKFVPGVPVSTPEFSFLVPKLKQVSEKELNQQKQEFSISEFLYSLRAVPRQVKTKPSLKLFQKHHKESGLQDQLLRLFNNYQNALTKKSGLLEVQPNFRARMIKTGASAKAERVQIQLGQTQNKPQIRILNAEYVLGLSKYRHANLELNKYVYKELNQGKSGLHVFVLDITGFKNQLMTESFSQYHKRALVRITAEIRGGPLLKIQHRGQVHRQSSEGLHHMVFEAELDPAPIFAEYSLGARDWLALTKLNDSWWIADVDSKSKYLQLAYQRRVLRKLEFSMIK